MFSNTQGVNLLAFPRTCPARTGSALEFFQDAPRASTCTAQSSDRRIAPLASRGPPTLPPNHLSTFERRGSGGRRRLSDWTRFSIIFYAFFKKIARPLMPAVAKSPNSSGKTDSVHFLLGLFQVNRPLGKVCETFSALKFAGKVGQTKCRDEFLRRSS